MRVKLGTLKRIIREAVEAELNEGLPPPYDVDKNLAAASVFPFRNREAELAVAADEAERAEIEAANAARGAAETRFQQDRVARERADSESYMAGLRAAARSAGVSSVTDSAGTTRSIDDLAVNVYSDYRKYPDADGSFYTNEEIIDMAVEDMIGLSDGTRTYADIKRARDEHTKDALRVFKNKPPQRTV